MRPSTRWAERALSLALVGIPFFCTTLGGCTPTTFEEMSGIHRHADLQQRGVRANAVITSIHEQGQGEYRRTYYPGPLCNVSVHVTMASGETFDASTQQFVPFTKLASFAPGSAITVRFDPNNHYAVFAEIPPDPVIAIDAGGDAGAGAGAGDKSL